MSYYTSSQRIVFIRKFGFDIKETNPPIPNAEELSWSAVILAIFVSLPMSQFMGSLVRAFSVTAIIYTIILTPILMATFFPNWARPWRPRIPRISFALSCGAVAAALGILGASLIVGEGDVVSGFERYRERVYPFSFLHALWATLIGASITIGAYPDVTKLRGWQQYRQWGSLTEGLIAACLSFGIVWFYVKPELIELRCQIPLDSNVCARLRGPGLYIVPQAAAFLLGFLVPTWYRANMYRSSQAKLGQAEEPQ